MRYVAITWIVLAVLLAACAESSPPATSSSAPSGGSSLDGLTLLMTKSPTCSCCSGHEAYLRRLGVQVSVTVTEDINAVKDVYAVPAEMRSCHTSTIGRYFVEGHVPYAAIERLLAERPDIDGISLPGMPAGSPGMDGELQGPLVVYAVTDGRVVGEFGRF